MKHNVNKYVRAFCPRPFNLVKISSDGNVNMCCHQSNNYLGNLFEKPFEDIWFSYFAEGIRTDTKNGRLHPMCNTIECPFKYKDIAAEMTEIVANGRGYPTQLEFDLHGSHCNFGGLNPTPETACIMCPRSRPDFHQHLSAHPDRTDELVAKIAHIVPNLKTLNILGIAEPFWKDKIFEILEKFNFQRYKKQIAVWTTSNASVFDEQKQNRLLQLAEDTDIHFSLDAATPETFLKIRRSHTFHTCCKNIKSWCAKRDECKKNQTGKHFVRMHNNINTLNLHEVNDMVLMSKDMGIDLLVLLPTHDCGGSHKSLESIIVNPQNYKRFLKAEESAKKLAESIGLEILFSRPLSLNIELKPPTQLVELKIL